MTIAQEAPSTAASDVLALVRDACLGHAEAIAMLHTLIDAFNTWDCLVDKDRPVPDQRLHDTFHGLLIVLPRNEFYQRFQRELQPVIEATIINWHAANAMQWVDASPEAVVRAHVLRMRLLDIVVTAARIIGGLEHACAVARTLNTNVPAEKSQAFMTEIAANGPPVGFTAFGKHATQGA
jgi:hypothetical protein